MIAYLTIAIAALVMNNDISTVHAYPRFLPSCSWIDDSQPGGDFNRMNVEKYELAQSGCVITWDGEGSSFVPCKTYTVTVTSPEEYGQTLSAVGASIIANPDFETYEVQPGCRAQQKQKVSKYSFVAPKSGTVKLSALCGQYDIMYTAAKITLKAQKGNGVCAKPTKLPTAFPTKKPTKTPTAFPTKPTTSAPTTSPTAPTTAAPTVKPTTAAPTKKPTKPTRSPTIKPTKKPIAGR